MRGKYAPVAVAAALAVSGLAHSQQDGQAQNQQAQDGQGQQGDIPTIAEWNYDRIYQQGGVRGENLLGAEVVGGDGEEIGEVENAVLNQNNEMVGIIAEVGGFWDIADRHVAVPFERVAFTEDGVSVPVSEDNVDEFDLFGNQEFVPAAAFETGQGPVGGNWRLTDLIDDYAALNDGSRFGYVDDVLISRSGEIQAVVVESSQAFGGDAYAYPFNAYAHGWRPGDMAWQLPYSEQDATGLNNFNYGQYDGQLSG